MTESMSASEAKSLQIRLEASGLDAIRATKILESIGIKGASLRDVEDNVLIFTVHNFLSCVAPLTKAFGRARNESNPAWAQKRLVWLVKEHNGFVALVQTGNLSPLLMFRQL